MRKESSVSADKLRGGAIVKHLPKRALSLALSAILVIGLMPSLSWAQDLPEVATQDETAAVVDDVATDGVAAKVAAGEVAESDAASMVDGEAKTPSVSGNALEIESLLEPLATDGDATDQWDGETNSTPSGSGTAEDPYLIYSGAELAWFSTQSQTSGYTGCAKLMKNINLGTNTWTSISKTSSAVGGYSGTFDGNGFTVIINSSFTKSPAGLFKGIGKTGVVKNLTVEGSVFASTGKIGAIAGENYGTIEYCKNKASVSVNCSGSGNVCAGGIAAYNYGIIDHCVNYGAVTTTTTSSYASAYSGGIVAYVTCNAVSVVANQTLIQNCYNAGGISSTSAKGDAAAYAGGIAGYSSYGNSSNKYVIKNVLNAGTISCSQAGGVTGVHGYSASSAVLANNVYENAFYVAETASVLFNTSSSSYAADQVATSTNSGSVSASYSADADWVKTNLGEWFVTLLNLTPDTEQDVSITISDNCYVLSNAGESADQIYSASITSAVDEGCIPVYNNTQFVKCADGTYRILIDAQTASAGIKANEISFVQGTAQTVSDITDINGNGKFNIADVQIIYDMAAGNHSISNEKLPMASWLSADVLGDGVVDAADAYKALYNLVFPEGETL